MDYSETVIQFPFGEEFPQKKSLLREITLLSVVFSIHIYMFINMHLTVCHEWSNTL